MTTSKVCAVAIIVVVGAAPAFAQSHRARATRIAVRSVVHGAARPVIRGRSFRAAPRVYAAPIRAFPAFGYAFRPRVPVAAGLVAGYGIAYPYGRYAYASSYSAAPIVSAAPYGGDVGGISFAIAPSDALVIVDGRGAGVVGAFARSEPLILAPGRHHVEIRAQGFRPVAFDADVVPNVVVPYYGTLQR